MTWEKETVSTRSAIGLDRKARISMTWVLLSTPIRYPRPPRSRQRLDAGAGRIHEGGPARQVPVTFGRRERGLAQGTSIRAASPVIQESWGARPFGSRRSPGFEHILEGLPFNLQRPQWKSKQVSSQSFRLSR